MTSSASLLGIFPLVIATGAGSASRWSLGTTLFGGLLVSTILSLLIVPVLYVIIKNLEERFLKRKPSTRSGPPSSDGREEDQSPALAQQSSAAVGTRSGDGNAPNDSTK
jgi:HAE1 family hydrophobic/amphiphilic exporter-1